MLAGMPKPDIHRLIDLQKLLLEFQAIDRALYIPGRGERHENDIEHSYNLAMTAWFLAQHFPELDRGEVIRCALAHDMVEIHAGDTMIFHNPEGMATKKDRETAALQKLAEDWADFPDLLETLHRYEARESAEARFVYALDKVMPAIMNYLQGGEVWRKHQVSLADLHELKDAKVALSPQVLPYYHELMALLEANPQLFNENI
jgi:putative hydrolase of HD superfamily